MAFAKRRSKSAEPQQAKQGQQQVRLAKDWQQPRRAFDMGKDYHTLPRFMPDFGREPKQTAK